MQENRQLVLPSEIGAILQLAEMEAAGSMTPGYLNLIINYKIFLLFFKAAFVFAGAAF